jgi:hypothetical protein
MTLNVLLSSSYKRKVLITPKEKLKTSLWLAIFKIFWDEFV